MTSLHWFTIGQLLEEYATGGLTAFEVVEATLERIEATEARLYTYATVAAESARADAARADVAASEGRLIGPLHGDPVAVEDLIETAGIPPHPWIRSVRSLGRWPTPRACSSR